MTEPLLGLVSLAAEAHPPDSVWAQLATPVSILVFLGSTYLLLRSNLGTKRGYLVLATVFFGFMLLHSFFWAFGGLGTNPAAGPRTLPGQPIGELEPRWIPFAQDSRLVEQEEHLQVVQDFPEGFEVVEGAGEDEILGQAQEQVDAETYDLLEEAVTDVRNFFADDSVFGADGRGELDPEQGIDRLGDLDEPVELGWTTAAGDLVVGITYAEFDDEEFELVEDGYAYTAFGYFEEGALTLPALLFAGISLVLFALHAWLLDRDERLEKREQQELGEELEEPERVPAGT